jgi:undecaprenyl-diphosphatase
MLRSLLRLARSEITLLVLFGAVVTAIFVFAEIAEEVTEGDANTFDMAVLDAMRADGPSDPVGPEWFEDMARDITSLGSTGMLVLVVVGAGAYLLLARKRASAIYLVLSVVTGTVVSTLLKDMFGRDRPDAIYQAAPTFTASFPSGHSFLSAVTYLTLGALLMRTQTRFTMKAYVMSTATVIVLLVGLTRAYMGVHWATDVLAGWALGAGWAALCWAVMVLLQRRHTVEAPEEERPVLEG